MRMSRFTETQRVSILNETYAGATIKNLCRKHAVSEGTYCRNKSIYAGMAASDLRRVRELEVSRCR